MYHFAILDPRTIPAAVEANQKIFDAATGGIYGIEVTVPALVTQCDLGNLDPQHTGTRSNIAACAAALTCMLPPDGATLVTNRADADSVLAMAILAIREDGRELVDDWKVWAVSAGDSAPTGPWIRDYTPPVEFAQANTVAMNFRTPLADRVARLAEWLLGAKLPESAPNDYSAISVELSDCGRYSLARADGPAGKGACGAGYRLAPVVIAVNKQFTLNPREVPPHLKYTVARWNATHVPMDWDGLKTDLRALEPGWGGSDSVVGSPQGEASKLTLEQVVEVVERHLI